MIDCHSHVSSPHPGKDEKEKMLVYQTDSYGHDTSSAAAQLAPLPSAMKTTARDLKPAKRVSFTLPKTGKEQCVSSNLHTATNASPTGPRVIQDLEAAKAAVIFMDFPETLVQLVIDTRNLEPHNDFSTVEQLYQRACELAENPQRQADLYMQLYQHQQALQTSPSSTERSQIQNGVKDNEHDCLKTSNAGADVQMHPAEMSGASCQLATASSACFASSGSGTAAASHTGPKHLLSGMAKASGAAKDTLPLSSSTPAENGRKTARHTHNVDHNSEANLSSLSNMEEPVSDITKTSPTIQLQDRVKKLAAEKRWLTRRKMCRACQEVDLSSSGVTFLPCGHFITCEVCSEKFDDCPACGKVIMGTVRTFLS